ncbi:MAG: Do family serine endopeptidase [Bacteroidales bacterium]|nr:Do family serine endopeptidase [Bacteroidales bacterium]MDY0197151.1 Do family serine endopeptidase [Tenuifilaceae bacterium]
MKANRVLYPILYSIIGGLIVFFSSQLIVSNPQSVVYSSNDSTPYHLTSFTTSAGEQTDFTYAAEISVHGVVHVKTKSVRSQPNYSFGNPLFDYFFGPQYKQESQPVMGSGSGVIISKDGYILTNNHVIDRAENIEVVLNDKRTFDAKVIGTDPSTDLAIIKIDEDNLPFILFGNSDNVKLGEWVLAVGNPFNLNSTVTAGIVSAKARNINIYNSNYAIEAFIQTDAAVNPGNSGGALVNLSGELIGINTAIASQTGSFAGYSFAIPSAIAQKVALDIIEYGEVQRAILGVTISELTAERAKEKNIKELKGVLIEEIAKESAAEEVGLKKGDIILEINGVAVNSPNQLQEQISKYRPKDKIQIAINRSDKRKQYEVTLRNMRGDFEIVRPNEIAEVLGAELKEVDSNMLRNLGIKNGIQVTKLKDGKLKEGGIKEGFIITRINRKNVTNVKELNQILQSESGGVLIEGIYPSGVVAYYAIGL